MKEGNAKGWAAVAALFVLGFFAPNVPIAFLYGIVFIIYLGYLLEQDIL